MDCSPGQPGLAVMEPVQRSAKFPSHNAHGSQEKENVVRLLQRWHTFWLTMSKGEDRL